MSYFSQMPFISIIIPFRNEEKHLADCINSVLKNDYPKDKTEILLIDGLSSDQSLTIINTFISQYPFIKLISNEKKIFPAAVNLGFNNSKGDFIIILGAHAVYEESYISGCVNASLNHDADNTGGILNTVGLNTSFIGKAITYSLSSSFGVGNATFRTGSNEVKEVDTVFGGCYKRSVFEKIGMFNENLVSSSDMDFNVRLKKQGGKIILDPLVKATYYTRTSFGKFIKNNYRNGYWAIYPMKYLDYIPVKLRHFIPLLFLSGLLGGIVLSFFFPFFIYILSGALALYFIAALIFSSKFLSKGLHYFLFLPLLFFLLHINYGIGSFIALIKVVIGKIFRNG